MITAIVIVSLVIIAFGYVVFWGAPYVPSHRKEVEEAFKKLYSLSKKDTIVDLGSGDGVVLRVAARKVKRAIGYELNPLLVVISRLLSKRFNNIIIHTINFWNNHLPEGTTVVYVFSVTRDMAKLEKKLQAEAEYLGRSLYLVLYAMSLPTQQPTKVYRAHTLYTFIPLHPR